MNFLKRLNDNTIQLCCGGNNCPTVTKIDDATVEIQDDDGNKIRVKPGQAKLISDAVTEIDAKKNELLFG
jgi:preprotein translocase subunit YajC